MKGSASHATGPGDARPTVRINNGTITAPEPGTTTVKRRFRSRRLMGDEATGLRRGAWLRR
jgi:hypothetical protein